MKLQKISWKLLALVVLFIASLWVHSDTANAADFTVIKTDSSPDMYLRIPIGRYKIHDQETWNRWGFTWGMVHIISNAEMNSIPQGPDVTRAMRPFGNPTVYVVENGVTRAVTSAEAFVLSGYSWSDISDVEHILIDQLSAGPNLETPRVVRSPSDGSIYYVQGGKKHHIVDQDTYNNWGFTGYINSELVNTIPTGAPLTRLVRPTGNPTVWVIDHGTRRALPSEDALLLNGFSWSSVVDADPDLISSLPMGDIFYAPTTVKIPGSDQLYMIYNGKRYPVSDSDTNTNWGFSRFGTLTTAVASSYPQGPSVTRLVRTEDGAVWRVKDQERRLIPSAGAFDGFGFKWSDVTDLPSGSLFILKTGAVLSLLTDNFQGIQIPFSTGRTGLEQHLWTTAGEGTEADHYKLSNLPQKGDFLDCSAHGCLQNGVAGTGAFGLLDPLVEQWYITMRWNYCTWKETTGLDSFGRPATICVDVVNSGASTKANHKYKKVIVVNPRTNRKVVVAVGESGPAIWVTREQGVVAGLSPEAVNYLQANYNTNGDQLQYGWSVDQTIPLGPINW
jgi:hypothetical protein